MTAATSAPLQTARAGAARAIGRVTWALRPLRRGPMPSIRSLADAGGTAVDAYWSDYTINTLGLWTPARSRRHLEWRFEQYPLFREFTGLWGEHDDEVLLDYGCGPGNDLVGFALHTGARRLIGIDVSASALRFAAERLALHRVDPGRVELIRSLDAATAIPLENDSVDYFQSQGVLHHTSDPDSILAELHRVLRPGGRGCVMVYNRDSVWYHLYVAYERMVRDDVFPGLAIDEVFTRSTDGPDCPVSHSYTGDEFLAKCRAAGFEGEYVGGYLSLHELASLDTSCAQAIADERLGEEHRRFLRELTYDSAGRPMHAGQHAGIGGVYRLRKATA